MLLPERVGIVRETRGFCLVTRPRVQQFANSADQTLSKFTVSGAFSFLFGNFKAAVLFGDDFIRTFAQNGNELTDGSADGFC